MSDLTANLALPLLQPAQAQKHVTHNEALILLDLLVQGAVLDRDRTSPPPDASEGQCHIVATAATGLWAGRSGAIAAFINNGWVFLTPNLGWRLRLLDQGEDVIFTEIGWQSQADLPLKVRDLGVNASSDATNRLAVSAPATLLTHDGAGHQLKINKASGTETATVMFQSNWAGRAEIGLAGSEDLALKVSADGSSFTEALRFDRSTGLASGAAIAASASDGTSGRLLRVGAGHQQLDASLYRQGNILGVVGQSAGLPTGAVIERGSNANGEYIRFADGTQIATMTISRSHSEGTIGMVYTLPAAFATPPSFFGNAANGQMTGTGASARIRLHNQARLATHSATQVRLVILTGALAFDLYSETAALADLSTADASGTPMKWLCVAMGRWL